MFSVVFFKFLLLSHTSVSQSMAKFNSCIGRNGQQRNTESSTQLSWRLTDNRGCSYNSKSVQLTRIRVGQEDRKEDPMPKPKPNEQTPSIPFHHSVFHVPCHWHRVIYFLRQAANLPITLRPRGRKYDPYYYIIIHKTTA